MQADSRAVRETRLRQFVEDESVSLLGTLRVYVVRANLATTPRAVNAMASELLNEVVAEALEHADRLRPDGQPRAWMLGIAANLIKRKQAERAKRNHREPLVRDLYSDPYNTMSDDDLFDRFAAFVAGNSADNPARRFEEDEQVSAMLAHLSEDDQRVVRLAVLNELDGRALAHELGIKPGAARVRLHRALGRLREALSVEVEHNG